MALERACVSMRSTLTAHIIADCKTTHPLTVQIHDTSDSGVGMNWASLTNWVSSMASSPAAYHAHHDMRVQGSGEARDREDTTHKLGIAVKSVETVLISANQAAAPESPCTPFER